ncbi:hypothetical protein HY496_02470 [Candidatus Woesearchaeota archaeon]|nr:hypothetical protein [Candidatus Woesearchaeota archaeon]
MTSTDTQRCEICKGSLVLGEEVVQIHLNGNPHTLCWGCATDWNTLSLQALQYLITRRDHRSTMLESWMSPSPITPTNNPKSLQIIVQVLVGLLIVGALGFFLSQ